MDSDGSKWILMDPSGFWWFQKDIDGSQWFQMDIDGSQWFLMDPNENLCLPMVSVGYNCMMALYDYDGSNGYW